MPRRASRVAVVGAGAVGSAIAYAMLLRGSAREVVLYDINADKVNAEVLDLAHGISFTPMNSVGGGDDISVCADADVVVITAGAKQKPGQSRLDLAGATIDIMRTLVPQLVEVAPHAVHLMVANPVDVVTQAGLAISGLGPNQFFGSGTVLDTSRLRYLVARRAGVAVQSVHGYIAGEHGDSEVPMWSSATIGGIPVEDWPAATGTDVLDQADRDQIRHEVVHAADTIIRGKGATNYAIGLSTARIIEAVLRDEHRVLSVSSRLPDVYGSGPVCMSMPTIIGRDGAGRTLTLPASPAEQASLLASAESIRAVAARFGF
ncbi:L-lactate dehydrogenase [Georgenia sp. Z1491]|uniref:L-lactate dehydrogenase n=1 Tax=Georgenia sp. Z1491 TaxID=3416707 RepID=UPI003CE78028